MVVEELHRQEETVRCAKAVSQAKQGPTGNWEGVEKKKIKWRALRSVEASRIRFMIGARCDVPPSPQNFNGLVSGLVIRSEFVFSLYFGTRDSNI